MTTHAPLVAVLLCCISAATASPAEAAANYIQIENAKPGTSEWTLTKPGYSTGVIEGYASLTSVNRGGQIKLFVNTSEPTYTLDVFRMGHYGGLGGRRVMGTVTRKGTAQVRPAPDPVTGLIECNWTDPYILSIPNPVDATTWMSGIYLVKLTAGVSGTQQYIMFVVRDDARLTDLILTQAVSTYQAYNVWGGKSLYGTAVNRGDTANAAHKVSFDRPYYGDETFGAGEFTFWEFPMIRWLEAGGYDVSYATSIDLDRDPTLLLSHKAFLSVGHDEYWSWRMRDHVEGARDRGVSLGFFSANSSYWQVRFEPRVVDSEPGRTMVGYKEAVEQDPLWPTNLATTLWRSSPVNRPEHAMIGVGFITQARPAFVVEDASHWAFTGTGLQNGDRLVNADGTAFLGYEVDAMGPASPFNTQRLAHSPVNAAAANFSDMAVYTAASGATVFATGSISWSQTVPQIQQITRNVLARLVNGAFADQPPLRAPLPVPFVAQDIGDVGRPGFVAMAGAQSFTLNGAGRESVSGIDAMYFAYQPMSGDGQLVARLTTLQLYWNNRAGLMIRESLAPGARYVALLGRPSESRRVNGSGVNEGVELWVKDQVGVKRRVTGSLDQNLPNWLKLIRTGNTFNAYLSSDGVSWVAVGTASVPMSGTVYVGAGVQSAQYGVWATARFDNVSVTNVVPRITLPDGWTGSDVGAVGLATGSSSFDAAAAAFSVTGAGSDIWGAADAFHYAHTRLSGDGSMVARVTAVQNLAPWTKAGVMIRDTLDPGSAHAFMLVSAGKGLAFQRRAVTKGTSTSTPGGLIAAPRWLRLTRSSSVLSAYQSKDGISWTLVGSETIAMRADVYVGLAVSSHVTGSAALATFDNVSVLPAVAPLCDVTLDRTSFYSGAGTTGVAATWYINVTAAPSCSWTARSDADWLEVKNPVTGSYVHATDVSLTGTSSVRVHTLANSGPKRTAHVVINGVTYTVTQDLGS